MAEDKCAFVGVLDLVCILQMSTSTSFSMHAIDVNKVVQMV